MNPGEKRLGNIEEFYGVASCCGQMPRIQDSHDPCGSTDRRIFCDHCYSEVGWMHRPSATRVWNKRKNREDLTR